MPNYSCEYFNDYLPWKCLHGCLMDNETEVINFGLTLGAYPRQGSSILFDLFVIVFHSIYLYPVIYPPEQYILFFKHMG